MVRSRVALLLVVLVAAAASGAEPVSAALDRVPDGTAICVVVRDLQTHLQAVAKSPFFAWFRQSPLGERILDPQELLKLKQLHDFFAEQLGVTGEQLLDDVVGDAIVLAYMPGPAGKPDAELGVILISPRKPEVMAKLIEKLNDLQQKSGEIKAVRERTYKGLTFVEREKVDGALEYYQLSDGVFAFTGQLGGIHGVVDRQVAKPSSPSSVRRAIDRLGLEKRMAVAWFNPRSFDAELKLKHEATKDASERAFLGRFREVWAATDSFALDLHVDNGLELGVVAEFDPSKLPPELRNLAFPKSGPSAVSGKIPPEAMFAVSGRLDVPNLVAALATFLPAEGKASLKAVGEQFIGPLIGRDKLPAVLAGIGPDWAFWTTVPNDAKVWMPEWTFAVKVSEPTARPLQQAVEFALQTARIAHNRDHADQIDLHEEVQGGIVVKSLVNETGFPAGFRPAFAVVEGYFVFASTPEVVRKFASTKPALAKDAPLVRLSGTRLRSYLTAHGPAVASFLAKSQGRPVESVERELKDLTAVLEAIDRLEITRVSKNKTVRFAVRIELTKPLKSVSPK